MPLRTAASKSDPRARIAELEVALARETRVAEALREVGLALGTTLDLDELLELILREVTEGLDAERATLYLLDESSEELVSRIMHGGKVREIRLKVGQGIAGHAARTGKPIHVRDAYKDPRFSPEWDRASGYRTKSILAAPMKNHLGRIIGVLQVLNRKSGSFTDTDMAILSALAMEAAVSIDNVRLFLKVRQKNMELLQIKEQLEHRVRDLKLLFTLERAMGRASSMEELFLAVLGEAMRSCEARAAAVAMRDGELGRISLHVVDDRHRKLRVLPLREGQGLIGHAMRHNEVVLSVRATDDRRADPELDSLVGFATETALAVPLEGEEGEPVGAIALYNKRSPRGFSEEDRQLLELIAANASTSVQLQQARDAREREERLSTIGRLLSGVIHDLKTPLTVISGYVQLMQEANDRGTRDRHATLILKQFEHIGTMQREVLEFARGERNVLVRKVYLDKFFSDARVSLEHELLQRGVELTVEITDKGTARFDEGKILRIVHNLARNAAEAMAPKGGKFVIRVTRDKPSGDIVVTFADTGPGIPREIEHRVFQSFVTAGKKGGTGLGLAIVKKIAEEHSGSIAAASTPKGATFTLRLPQR